MRKFTTILALVVISGSFNACSPWEDESSDSDSNNLGPTMLLKEMVTVQEDVTIKQVYEYDSEDRVKKVKGYMDLNDLTSYTDIIYTYVNANTVKINTNTYLSGDLFSESLTESVVDGNNVNITMSLNGEEMLTAVGSFSTPCGINTLSQSVNFMGQEITSTSVYQYTDNNCSYKHNVDNQLFETVTNDDKRNPNVSEQSYIMGIVTRNPLKVVDHEENTITEYVYVYNTNNYPVSAEVTIKDNSGELLESYTVSYTYY